MCVMHSKSDNVAIMINDEADEIIKELFNWLKNKYQNNLELQVCLWLCLFIVLQMSLYRIISYYKFDSWWIIYRFSWLDKNKKATTNPINEQDSKCFQYAITVSLNNKEIGKYPERITKIKPFTNKYKWEGINFLSQKDDSKKTEKNKRTIALNVLYAKKEKIYPAYVSKNNSNSEKQVAF